MSVVEPSRLWILLAVVVISITVPRTGGIGILDCKGSSEGQVHVQGTTINSPDHYAVFVLWRVVAKTIILRMHNGLLKN